MTSPDVPPFTMTDRRGVSRSLSGLVTGGADTEMRRLREAGYSLPKSPTQARQAAAQVQQKVTTQGEMAADIKGEMARMRRSRMGNIRRTGADVSMALPKVRQPLSSLEDKGIPWNMSNPKEQADARTWARLFYATHDLVPLLVDIYARFPVTGLELSSRDSKIEQFYSDMFLNELAYEEFLPEALGREYFLSGEVTSLAHFDESLGIWASEEILNPDMVRVTRSLFNEQERVQLVVKDMVESLRNPMGTADESPSARLERTHEYQTLVRQYPEIIRAAEQDDGLDISDALWSRLVNRTSPWDTRGTPFLMRSFRTLMMEESLNAAQDAVADRLYSPLILATLGIPDMGDGEPWIPDVGELGDLREDMQAALAADFKLMVHHFGLQIQPVFGRESVPRFDQDYNRIDAKLMQAWGIGQALIMGGTAAAGTYASSALNREVCELLMKGFQKKVIRHMRKRMEVIAEAQEHYDYELKGGIRRPIYREVVEEDPETGEKHIIRRPKLLIPDINFASLNLRDESTERQFIAQLKQMGVPVSDKTLAVNLPADFDQEIQRQTEEMVKKQVAEAESMAKVQRLCDEKNLPYPGWLVESLNQTLALRQSKAQTDLMEGQAEMQEQQISQMSPAGQMGLLNPPPPAPPPEEERSPAPESAEPPRNRARPEVSDEMRAGAPRAAKKTGSARIRPLSVFERGPSSYGSLSRADEKRAEAAVRRREIMARHIDPTVSDLIGDPEFFQMLNMGAYQGQIEADWPEIAAGNGDRVPESMQLLQEMTEQYADATGIAPDWR